MDKYQIKIINKIDEFEFIIRLWNSIKGKVGFPLNTGNEKLIRLRFDALIRIKNGDEDITIGIYGDFPEVITKRIYWENFTYNEIEKFCKDFILYLDKDINYPSASLELGKGRRIATLSIKKSHATNNYFIIVYHFYDGEGRRNQELYVHGIWEVELSEEFKKSLDMEK
ncbi:MAG: hypothetical protein LBP34_00300 [Flavobacteriaceae bacterium]|jgi:hypothetical protein|nr:hypothetical protein [Flavobacteriaceae bacterium]